VQTDALDSAGATAYFDTPERAERLQLVAHLIRNAEAVPYVRGPKGAGKTCFAERLASLFRQEATLVELDGLAHPEVPVAVHQALGVSGEWPAAALDAVMDGDLVVMVDNADHLDAAAMDDLRQLRSAGGRIVLLGVGDPAELPGQWNIQLIDLPPFSASQSQEFVGFVSPGAELSLTDSQLTRLYRMAQGYPGPLLDALQGRATGRQGLRIPWQWLLGGGAAVLAALVLWQQDAINALFRPQAEPQVSSPLHPPLEEAPASESGKPIAIPPLTRPTSPAQPEAIARPEAAGPASREPPSAAAEQNQRPAPQAAATVVAKTPALTPTETKPAPAQPTAPAAVSTTAASRPAQSGPSPHQPPGAVTAAAPEPPLEQAAPPVAETAPAPAPTQQPKPTAEPAGKPAVSATEQDDLAWLRSRQGGHYTLQLAAAHSREPLLQVVRRHQLPSRFALFTRNLGGKPWYSLVYGDFKDRKAAMQALQGLPPDLRAKDAWPRTFSSIWAQLPAKAPKP
jgi:DamX protein